MRTSRPSSGSLFYLAVATALLVPATSNASTIVYPTLVAHGTYRNDGMYGGSSLAGRSYDGTLLVEYRNYFTFQLGAYVGRAASATLSIWQPNGGYNSVHASETMTFYDVATNPSFLPAGLPNPLTNYNDLGSGTIFGTTQILAPPNHEYFEYTEFKVMLNQAALDSMTKAMGKSIWAIGGAVTSLDPGSLAYQYVFGFTAPGYEPQPKLMIELVPEPSSLILAAFGVVSLAFYSWRKRPRA